MQSSSYKWLQVFLWCICAFHVIVGLGLNLFPQFPELMAGYYGATATWDAHFAYILKPLGVFMLALGILAAFAARKPLTHEIVVYAFIVVFVGRALQRIVFRNDIYEAFAIGPGRNIGNSIFFFAMAIALFLLHRYVKTTASRSQATAA